MAHIWNRVKQEAVLSVAVVLAVISAFFVFPDREYIDYIDFRTLAILFSLMAVMAGLRSQGVFDALGRALLQRTRGTKPIMLVLVVLCFFGSMLITNDVALITFVPFTFVVLDMLGSDVRSRWVLRVVCMQTIAANLGSMLTPIGNPQNLYLYGKSGMGMGAFVMLMLPYALCSLVLLVAWLMLSDRSSASHQAQIRWNIGQTPDRKKVILYLLLFAVCLLTVVRLVDYMVMLLIVAAVVAVMDRKTFRNIDYSLLLTFVAFFVFIGNLGRIPFFSNWLRSLLVGAEVPVAVLTSQVTSNVPAALLLSGFTDKTEALIIGTNLGGLGTLIASMASLISYRQIAREEPTRKGVYFRMFTVSNVIFLIILMVLWYILK